MSSMVRPLAGRQGRGNTVTTNLQGQLATGRGAGYEKKAGLFGKPNKRVLGGCAHAINRTTPLERVSEVPFGKPNSYDLNSCVTG